MLATVAIIVFDGADDLDVSGAASVLHKAGDIVVCFVSALGVPSHTTSLGLVVSCAPRPPAADAILFPGGGAALQTVLDPVVVAWVRARTCDGAQLFSVCSGAYLAGQCCRLENVEVAVHGAKREALVSRHRAIAASGLIRRCELTSISGPQQGGMTKSVAMGLEILDRFAPAHRSAVVRRLELDETDGMVRQRRSPQI